MNTFEWRLDTIATTTPSAAAQSCAEQPQSNQVTSSTQRRRSLEQTCSEESAGLLLNALTMDTVTILRLVPTMV